MCYCWQTLMCTQQGVRHCFLICKWWVQTTQILFFFLRWGVITDDNDVIFQFEDVLKTWLDTTHLLNVKLTSWICSSKITIQNIYTTATMSHCVKSRHHPPHFSHFGTTLHVGDTKCRQIKVIYCLQTQQLSAELSCAEVKEQRGQAAQLMLNPNAAEMSWKISVVTLSHRDVEHQQRQCQEVIGRRLRRADIGGPGDDVWRREPTLKWLSVQGEPCGPRPCYEGQACRCLCITVDTQVSLRIPRSVNACGRKQRKAVLI